MTINQHDLEAQTAKFNFGPANEAVANGHYDKASRILRQAVAESEIDGTLDPVLLPSIDVLAEKYFHSGQYASAASLYRMVLEVRTKLLGIDHPEVREARRKLAQSLWQTGGLSPELLAENQ
jgi:hypothetical protein